MVSYDSPMAVTAVIPARHAASRFPGKPLALLLGRPMVEHVVRRCEEASCFEAVVVATDDDRIAQAVRDFGGKAVMTSPSCHSGTDRVAEVARTSSGAADDVFVNVQGDEPAIHPSSLQALARAFADPTVQMATLVRPLSEHERLNPNVVKVVRDEKGHALYFSRHDLPFSRDAHFELPRWAHVGIYGYRRQTLLKLASLPPTRLERAESLEQLRALGHGIGILCCETSHQTQAVDVPSDLPLAEAALVAYLQTR